MKADKFIESARKYWKKACKGSISDSCVDARNEYEQAKSISLTYRQHDNEERSTII